MTKEEIKDRYIGKSVGAVTGKDYNGKPVAGIQGECVGLIRQYTADLGLDQFPPVVGACNLWDQVHPQFEKIPNEPDTLPRCGDIVVFGAKKPYTKYGHTAIIVDACLDDMTCVEQDGYDKGKGCYQTWRNYVSCLGFFRPKQPRLISPEEYRKAISDAGSSHMNSRV